MKPFIEQINLREQQSILAFNYAKENFETPWHCHPQHELTYIEESVGTRFIGDNVSPYEPGELVLLRSNLPHCWKNQKQKISTSKSTVVQWNKGIYARAPELSAMFDMLKTASRGIIFQRAQTIHLIPLLKQLPTLAGSSLYVQLLGLLVHLSACNYTTLSEARFEDDLPSEFNSRMQNIHEFVEAYYSRKIYLKELADLVNMSEQSFSRFFTKMMGRPFFTFLNEYRINMASRMLMDTDWTISEVSFAAGFESPAFFHKQFNKYKNESPVKHRKSHVHKETNNQRHH